MKNHPLFARLRPVARRRLWGRAARTLALVWCATAAGSAALLLSAGWLGIPGLSPTLLLGVAGLVIAGLVALRTLRGPADLRDAAKVVEARHPELDGLLLTAVQQEPAPGGGFNFLQRRVLDEALAHSFGHDWPGAVPMSRLCALQALQFTAFLAFVAALVLIPKTPVGPHAGPAALLARLGSGVDITPGDTSLERGSSLVVLARFGGSPPRGAELVLAGTNGATHRLPLVRNLADPIFGGTVPEVTTNFTYRVEFDGGRSKDFRVSVYEHPRLERSVVDLTFPDYTGRPPKHIEDTRRVSAVEGSRLDLALQLNKSVATALLQPRATNLPHNPDPTFPPRRKPPTQDRGSRHR